MKFHAGNALVVVTLAAFVVGLMIVSVPSVSAPSPAPAPAPPPKPPRLPKGGSTIVIRIDYSTESSQPGVPETAVIVAGGQVPSTGWTNPRLKQTDEVQTPESPTGSPTRTDTLADLQFVADAPAGDVPQVMTAITATGAVSKTAYRGVRVWSSTNCVEHIWGSGKSTRALTLDVCKQHRDS